MDQTVMYRLSYGVFMLATKADGVVNGCITNTSIQVAGSPTRVAVAVTPQTSIRMGTVAEVW